MVYSNDRQRADEWLQGLERLLDSPASKASPDTKLAAYAAVVNARAMLVCADTVSQAMQTLQGDVLPQLRGILGDR